MGQDATSRRRLFGAIVLMVALFMLVAGETVLKAQLKNLGFLIYWLVCFAFTCLAILVAFLDVRSLGRRIRRERHQLLETTLNQIQSDAGKKRRGTG